MTIAEDIAYRLKVPVSTVELAIQSFNRGLSHYLNHADEAKGKIRIDGLCTFNVRETTLKKRVHNGTQTEYHEKILINLQQNKRKNARQKSIFLLNQGSND